MQRIPNTLHITDYTVLIQEEGGTLVRRKVHKLLGNSPEFDRLVVINYNAKGEDLHLNENVKPGIYEGVAKQGIVAYAIFES